MSSNSAHFRILLIDDDVDEFHIVERIVTAMSDIPIEVDHALRCSEGMTLLNGNRYDLILLDNRLSDAISAEFSVPFIRSAFSRAPIAIISSDISPDYLQPGHDLGVDHIVDKKDMITFLRDRLTEAGLTNSKPAPSAV